MASITFPFGDKRPAVFYGSSVIFKYYKQNKKLKSTIVLTLDLTDKKKEYLYAAEIPKKTGDVNITLDKEVIHAVPDFQVVAIDEKQFYLEPQINIEGRKRDHG